MELQIPEYTIELWDLNGNYVLDISRFVAPDIILKLNDADVVTFSIDHKQFVQLCADVNLTPRNVLYPAKTEVLVRRNGNILTGGSVSIADTGKDESGKKIIAVTVDGYDKYFATRYVKQNWIATDRSQIAWEAIDAVQSVPNGDYGVVRGVHTDTYPSDKTADYADVKSIIQQYTYAQPTTYDYDFTPSVVAGNIVKTFNTYLRKGSDRPEVELVDPQNIATMNIKRSADSLANKVIGLGAGIGDERIESIQQDATSQANYLVREKKQLFNSVTNQDTLDENTTGVLENSRGVLVTFDGVVEPGAIDLDVVTVGDSLTVRIDDDAYNDDINGLYRIYQLKISVDLNRKETITPSFYNPGGGGEITDEV